MAPAQARPGSSSGGSLRHVPAGTQHPLAEAPQGSKYPHGRHMGYSLVEPAGLSLSTSAEAEAAPPTQRQYAHGRHLGFENEATRARKPTQRQYPHGRHLGYPNLRLY